MLIYEKNNKLNINFDPSKSIEGTPDIQIGENEIKLGDTEITSENVLPTPTSEDVGKVPTVQEDGMYSLENIPSELPVATPEDVGKAVIVDEHGEYALGEAGGNDVLIVKLTGSGKTHTADMDAADIASAIISGKPVFLAAYVSGGGTSMYMCEPIVRYIGSGLKLQALTKYVTSATDIWVAGYEQSGEKGNTWTQVSRHITVSS